MSYGEPTEYTTSEPRPFTGPVNPCNENRVAHGNIEVTDTAPDGRTRRRLINRGHEECGPWE